MLRLVKLNLLLSFSVRAMSQNTAEGQKNVLGGALQLCGLDPLTGYFRDGYCVTGSSDVGRHVVAAAVTQEFLSFTKSRGNDLQTPHGSSFPGLKPGDRWCLCALRWREAFEAGVAPPVDLAATSAAALRFVTLTQLAAHALTPEQAQQAVARLNDTSASVPAQ